MKQVILPKKVLCPTELRFCNCADCGALLLGDSLKTWYYELGITSPVRRTLPAPVAGRIRGRPYCGTCLTSGTPKTTIHRYLHVPEPDEAWDDLVEVVT